MSILAQMRLSMRKGVHQLQFVPYASCSCAFDRIKSVLMKQHAHSDVS